MTVTFVKDLFEYFIQNPRVLVMLFLIYVALFFATMYFGRRKPGKNPFRLDRRVPLKPKVIVEAEREKVLKQRFKPSRVPEDLDAIVIGSGIGGTATAALLTQAGKKVLVLEQHDQAGGWCHTFIEKGFEFDTGIHYVGGMGEYTDNHILCDQITSGQLEWAEMDKAYDIVRIGDDKEFPIVAGKEDFKAALLEKFPEEEVAIQKFIDLTQKWRRSMLSFYMYKIYPKWFAKFMVYTGLCNLTTDFFKLSKVTITEAIDKITDNADLKAVLSYIFGDYGSLPKDTSCTLHSTFYLHYRNKAYYPRGGPSEITFHIIPEIERGGGKVFVNAPVSKILIDGKGRACGVQVLSKSGIETDIYAPLIISDAGVINTFTKLLPPEIAAKSEIFPLIKKVEPSAPMMFAFVGLRGTKSELGLKSSNIWYFQKADINSCRDEYMSLSAEDAGSTEPPMIFISFPSAKDDAWESKYPDKSTCLMITYSNFEWFSQWQNEKVKKRGDDYEGIKKAIGHMMWQRCLHFCPQLEDKVEYFDVGTPLSNNFYVATDKGEVYGLDHNKKRLEPDTCIKLRPETDIPGLVLTGQDIMTVGFGSALFGALITASHILHRNLYTDLQKLKKEVKRKDQISEEKKNA